MVVLALHDTHRSPSADTAPGSTAIATGESLGGVSGVGAPPWKRTMSVPAGGDAAAGTAGFRATMFGDPIAKRKQSLLPI
jgi:hypothetical protein